MSYGGDQSLKLKFSVSLLLTSRDVAIHNTFSKQYYSKLDVVILVCKSILVWGDVARK